MLHYYPPDRSLWDPWFVKDRSRRRYLMYHLSAPRGLDKRERDDNAEIWVAESTDLLRWESLGPAIVAGPAGSKYDLAIWSGNTYEMGGQWIMFFTGRCRADGTKQRIFAATSTEGESWVVRPQPLLEPPENHPIYSDSLNSRVFPAWRDPMYAAAPDGQHVIILTAMTHGATGPGCLGAAVSSDVLGPYRLTDPVLSPSAYDQMELPQLVTRDGTHYLFFTCAERDYDPAWARRVGGTTTGLHCWTSSAFGGPYAPIGGTGRIPGLGSGSGIYGAKLLETFEGETVVLGWHWAPASMQLGGSQQPVRAGVQPDSLSEPWRVRWDGPVPTVESPHALRD